MGVGVDVTSSSTEMVTVACPRGIGVVVLVMVLSSVSAVVVVTEGCFAGGTGASSRARRCSGRVFFC